MVPRGAAADHWVILLAQPGQVLGINLQTIGVVCIFASALWVLAVLIEWAYRNAIGSK